MSLYEYLLYLFSFSSSILTVREQAVNALETARSWQQEHKDRELDVQLIIEKQKQAIHTLSEDRQSLKRRLKELHRDFVIVNEKRQQYEDELKTQNFGYPIDSVKYRRGRMTRYNSYPDFLSAVIFFLKKNLCLFRTTFFIFFIQTDLMSQIKSTTKNIHRIRIDWQEGMADAVYHSDEF